jgi:cytochrome c oxidase cbb3-type subunit 2
MAEHLHQVPPVFVAAAGAVVLLPALLPLIRWRGRELFAVASGAAISLAVLSMQGKPHQTGGSAIQRGRTVYISEGCIHCHSQYVRPATEDVLLWGPVRSVAAVHQQTPPLIGNRRQGPDLSEVGARRSALWIRMHMIDPAAVSGTSIMPSYAVLFQDRRGEDLVSYLASLQDADPVLDRKRQQWAPAAEARVSANAGDGQRLYQRFCAQCHDPQAALRRRWNAAFRTLPLGFNASSTPGNSLPVSEEQFDALARLIKFGLPGTDMPGHELLSDQEISSLVLWLAPRTASVTHTLQPPHKE